MHLTPSRSQFTACIYAPRRLCKPEGPCVKAMHQQRRSPCVLRREAQRDAGALVWRQRQRPRRLQHKDAQAARLLLRGGCPKVNLAR